MIKAFKHWDLIKKIAFSDFKLRYQGSVLGFFWTFLEPLLLLIVFYVVFSQLMRMQIEQYQLFLLLGIISWRFLDFGTSGSIFSIISKKDIVKKVYFPREILVISSVFTAFLSAILEYLVFAVFLIYFNVIPGISLIIFPIILFAQIILILGLALGLSSLNVFFRDVGNIWRVVLQAGFFATPILYPISLLPENLSEIFQLNPMAQIITMQRDSIIYGNLPLWSDILYIYTFSILILIIGSLIFLKFEPRFAEEL